MSSYLTFKPGDLVRAKPDLVTHESGTYAWFIAKKTILPPSPLYRPNHHWEAVWSTCVDKEEMPIGIVLDDSTREDMGNFIKEYYLFIPVLIGERVAFVSYDHLKKVKT